MAVEEGRSGGGNGFLYFAVGALIVGVGVLAWMFYGGGGAAPSKSDTALERMADSVGDAADDMGDAARDAARKVPAPAPAPAPMPAPQPPPG